MELKFAIAGLDAGLKDLYRAPRQGDAGLDILCSKDTVVDPYGVTLVETNLILEIPPGFVGIVHDRSSMAYRGLHVLGGVIDSSYRGAIGVMLHNIMPTRAILQYGSKVAQIIFTPYEEVTILESCKVEEMTKSVRGNRGFGSTDEKLRY